MEGDVSQHEVSNSVSYESEELSVMKNLCYRVSSVAADHLNDVFSKHW
jgi:hypothetical protein